MRQRRTAAPSGACAGDLRIACVATYWVHCARCARGCWRVAASLAAEPVAPALVGSASASAISCLMSSPGAMQSIAPQRSVKSPVTRRRTPTKSPPPALPLQRTAGARSSRPLPAVPDSSRAPLSPLTGSIDRNGSRPQQIRVPAQQRQGEAVGDAPLPLLPARTAQQARPGPVPRARPDERPATRLAGRAEALGAPGGSCGWVERPDAGRCASGSAGSAAARAHAPCSLLHSFDRPAGPQGPGPGGAAPSRAAAARLAGLRINRQRVAAEGNLSAQQLSDLFSVAPLDPDRERPAARRRGCAPPAAPRACHPHRPAG
jgi:hypothetical protein